MRGSSIANEIVNEYKKQQYYNRKRREKCKDRNCDKCKYIDICEGCEDNEKMDI